MSSRSYPKFAVVGAGHGGKAMAAHLGIMGFSVNLYKRQGAGLEKIKSRGGIELTGAVEGFGRLNVVSSNMKEVIDNVDVIMVVVPAHVHKSIAKDCAPHLQDGQIVLLNPGRTGGTLEFKNVLKKKGVTTKVKLAEAQTLIYTCRSTEPTSSRILSIKKSVPVAALPATETENVLKVINEAYPRFTRAGSVLETGLNNIGAVFHPALVLLNSGRVHVMKGDFKFYTEGATPYICRVIEVLDKERLDVADAFGVKAVAAKEWLSLTYGVEGKDLYETLQNNPAYKKINAPPHLEHRYIYEDVPTGLVPLASLGDIAQVSTPTMKGLVNVASAMFATDFWSQGRSAEALGIAGLTVKEIRELILKGD